MTARKVVPQTLSQTIVNYVQPWVEMIPGSSYFIKEEKKVVEEESVHDAILRLAGLDVEEAENSLVTLLRKCSMDLPEIEKDRLNLYFKINTFQHKIDSCTFLTQFDQLRLLSSGEKKSVSQSWIALAVLDSQPVALKISFTPLEANGYVDNSLEVERKIYRRIINPLLLCGQTPHVLVYYSELDCKAFVESLGMQTDDNSFNLLREMKKSYQNGAHFNFDEMHASVVERAVGMTIHKTFQHFQDPDNRLAMNEPYTFGEIFLPVLFQVFYTLVVFTEIGLVHNDLHSGNIFVEVYRTPTTSRYLVGGKVYEIKSKFQSRFFDFDRGAKLATEYNSIVISNDKLTKGNYCKEFGQCPELNERSDLYTIVYMIHQYASSNTLLKQFLQKIVPKELLLRPNASDMPNKVTPGSTLVYPGRLCACKDKTCINCTPIRDSMILTPLEALNLPEFDRYIVNGKDSSEAFLWAPPSERASQLYKDLQK